MSMEERIYKAVQMLLDCNGAVICNVTPEEAVEIYQLEGIIVPEADWYV